MIRQPLLRGSWFGIPAIIIGFILLTIKLGFAADPAAQKKAAKPLPGADIFDAPNVVRMQILISEGGMNLLRGTGWGRGNQDRPTVRATIKDGKNVYTNVALHLKGAAGSFRPVDDHPALTLNFDKFAPGQSFHGLHKLSLNNSQQDRTFITEKLCREMFVAAGVPAPRADYAVVTLNGRRMGLYVLVEGYNKQFLHRYFKNTDGNLYDCGFCQDITQRLIVNSGAKPNDRSDLQNLVKACLLARQNNRLDELSKVLDLDRFYSMAAMEVIQCHWDGYVANRNNFRVYHDLDTDRMVFMPHGLDQMFGTGERESPRMRVIPRLNGIAAAAVIGTSEGRAKYLQRMRELRTNVFNVAKVTARVRQIEARLQPVLAEFGRGNAEDHHERVEQLCRNIAERGASLDEQLSVPSNPIAFGTNTVLKIEGWKPFNKMGQANFDLAASPSGRKLLHIIASANSGAASWRTRVTLKQGRYRFEGLLMTRKTRQDGDSGAVLRISGSVPQDRADGDTDWRQMGQVFEVNEPAGEVELVCELKGNRGEAWFDQGSLRLKRLDGR
jgi:spore coat protein H